MWKDTYSRWAWLGSSIDSYHSKTSRSWWWTLTHHLVVSLMLGLLAENVIDSDLTLLRLRRLIDVMGRCSVSSFPETKKPAFSGAGFFGQTNFLRICLPGNWTYRGNSYQICNLSVSANSRAFKQRVGQKVLSVFKKVPPLKFSYRQWLLPLAALCRVWRTGSMSLS